ncbi:MAG: FAD-dependent oxidoreductase [Chloroflexi bacterium]|nr:MAG: FAD-dependent oxidoreductase [Chloroflexota bacterium]TMG65175.1 MAG: FAD-dependent oxidoreductase [Chloroflexota bacterium]
MTRVLVLGGGIAGYCAALAARRDGADVTVVARAPGATALYAGGMEIVDDIAAVLRLPHHPLARLGMDAVGLATELDAAISTLQLALGKEGLRFQGGWRSRGLYADIHGLAHAANVVPESVAPGELGALSGKRVAVIGVPEVGDYDAASTAQALKELHGVEAFAEDVSIPDLPEGAALTDLYGRRAPSPRARGAAIAYPPGFVNLPPDGFELLASPPSPHGWRLQQAISLGAVATEIKALETTRDRVIAARAASRTFRADAFVLATGRHIGGGLRAGRVTSEPLLGLGVFYEGVPVASLGTRLHHLEYLDAGEEMRLGAMTDKRLHPLNEDGTVPYMNLYAAGAMLGGYEYGGDSGFGVPILTGWLAGRFAAKQDGAPQAPRAGSP